VILWILLGLAVPWGLTSCLKDFPVELPDELIWDPALAFPLGKDSLGLNKESSFDTTLLDMDSISGLPRWLDESRIYLERYMEFNVNSISQNINQVQRILWRVNFSNSFPHLMRSQLYLLNEQGSIIDSLFRDGPVDTPPGKHGPDGSLIKAGETQEDALFEGDQIAALDEVSDLLFSTDFDAAEADSLLLPYYADFFLEADVGMMLEIAYEF